MKPSKILMSESDLCCSHRSAYISTTVLSLTFLLKPSWLNVPKLPSVAPILLQVDIPRDLHNSFKTTFPAPNLNVSDRSLGPYIISYRFQHVLAISPICPCGWIVYWTIPEGKNLIKILFSPLTFVNHSCCTTFLLSLNLDYHHRRYRYLVWVVLKEEWVIIKKVHCMVNQHQL